MVRYTYLLPIRRRVFGAGEANVLRRYLVFVRSTGAETLVVDGSPVEVFQRHDQLWHDVCRHEPVDSRLQFLNDKVNGIHTGIRVATSEKIVLADDDIRYGRPEIDKVLQLLDTFEVVRPQNYLRLDLVGRDVCRSAANERREHSSELAGAYSVEPISHTLPFWAKMEAARMLINRATLRTADYPGTCAFRRSTMLIAGEYDGDVLFDNEELIRHLARAGARICYANDLFVPKRPPKFRKWLEQRPRQAYEDFGLRFKTFFFAFFLPVLIGLVVADRRWIALPLLASLVALAGWLRGEGRKYVALHTCFYAPLWVIERSLSTYWAFYWFITRGGYPFGERLLSKGIGRDWVEGGRIAARQ